METKTMTAKPCLSCRTTGGKIPRGYNRPTRVRGCCKRCYDRLRLGLTVTPTVQWDSAPAPLPPTFDLGTLVPRVPRPWGAASTPEWRKTVAYEQRRAEEWLAARAAVAA